MEDNMSRSRFWWFGALVLGVIVAGCPPKDRPQLTAVRRECPHTIDSLFTEGRPFASLDLLDTTRTLSGPGPIQNISVFHDCQRFADSAGTYGGLFTIFASHRMARLDTLIRADTSAGRAPFGGLDGDEALPAAQILSDAAYPRLGILEAGVSCLYLYRRGEWRAKMVSTGMRETDCSREADPDQLSGQNVTDLTVVSYHSTPFTNLADYPQAARWDSDREGSYYAGVACGTAWCEVGVEPAGRSQRYLERQPNGRAEARGLARIWDIKGWYDEQRLAVPGPNGGLVRHPTLVGVIFPDSLLESRTPREFGNAWVPVAYVGLSEDHPFYKERFNFDRTNVGGPFNTIELCQGSEAACGVPKGVPACKVDDSALDMRDLNPWWARIVAAGDGSPRYRCVTRYQFPTGVEYRGVTRWRWLADDETGWMRCLAGCCETT
jgi:hypothetical protein